MRLLNLSLLSVFLSYAYGATAERPNVVLIIGDDISHDDFGCYGNPAARTPHVDRLAANGRRYTNAFLTASSCSPSRSSIVTGRYPHNNGDASELHRPIAWHLPRFPALLRANGYYTVLSGKNHMPQEVPPAGKAAAPEPFEVVDAGQVPGNHGGHGNWVKHLRERPRDRPFFFWYAALDAHRDWDGDREWDETRFGPKHDPAKVSVPPFLIDNAATRADLASYYNEVTRFDHYIGEVVRELERQGALENTLLLILADNGRPFPRAKTRLHDSGMKTALVAHWPAGIREQGVECDSLVSAIDLAPTILELAGVSVPETVQGRSLTPLLRDPRARVRRYAFSEHNWHDYAANARSVRDGEFLYIANFQPAQAWQGPADSVRSPSFSALRAARDRGALSAAQEDVFMAPRPAEELYRVADDPHQLKNLAADPSFGAELRRLREVMQRWREETGDALPEKGSRDAFHRETGERLFPPRDTSYYGEPSGANRGASRIHEKGPH